ncbi:MAG TPA: LCP family protein [Thermoleophilaceae bacterium]|nr:LCP family protein [Thermoleophilaceae bacterium]
MAEKPEYTVYRSRKGPLSRFRREKPSGLDGLRGERQTKPRRTRKPISVGRIAKWLVLAVLGWILISVVIFLVSAQFAEHSSATAEAALTNSGSLFTGSNILVLGSDARPPDSKEPGAGGPARSDSMILMHVAFGSVRKVSILRDSQANIPGHGVQKINAAYALGGAGLAIQTVEQFMDHGLQINHVLEINFENFPKLIDALGGVDVTLKHCIHSNSFDGRVLILHKGSQHLSGKQALQFSRVRENRCAPNEDDRTRARRQQQVLAAIRSQLLSPQAFVRLPWISWAAPRTVRSDMRGPGLMTLFTDLLTGGGGRTKVLLPYGAQGTQLLVSDGAKARAVDYLENGR